MSKRVLVFGTFDGIHSGHEFFLRTCKARATELVVGVARDLHVREFKGRKPNVTEVRRLEAVAAMPFVDQAQLCDEEISSFEIIRKTKPDLIMLGHDQIDLEAALVAWMDESGQYVPMIRCKKI